MMKILKIALIISMTMMNITNAQNNDNISGVYSLGSSSPEGGSHLIVLENGSYAIMYFGGIQTGLWKETKNNDYLFTPNLKESKFELFGRHNQDLKNSIKIFFNGFESSETFVHLGDAKEKEYSMKRVFNQDANCFSFPYVHTFSAIPGNISFMFKYYEEKNGRIITFKNPERYNDFVASFIEVDRHDAQSFSATFKDDKLYFEDANYASKSPLDEDSEDIEFVRNFIATEKNKETIYLNPSYNLFGDLESGQDDQDIHKYHVFNEQKNAFIDNNYYVEGQEHIQSDDSFDNMAIIYAYMVLKDYTSTETERYSIDENPLFQVSCD